VVILFLIFLRGLAQSRRQHRSATAYDSEERDNPPNAKHGHCGLPNAPLTTAESSWTKARKNKPIRIV